MSTPWHTVRVFISSTFRDMHAERDHLVRFVFPRLREELLPRRIHLIDVDLRWGVTSDQDVLSVCREIIDECRPRFVCLLGGRYGWVPPGRKTSITAEEVHYAVLGRMRDHGYASFYFRDPQATAAMGETIPGEYREPPGSITARQLTALKQAITDAGLQTYTYTARWDPHQQRLVDLKTFGNQVYQNLLASIEDQYGAKVPTPLDVFAEEAAAMEAFIAERTEGYVIGSRQELLNDLTTFTKASGPPNIFLLTGASGSGKSALLAKCLADLYPSQFGTGHPALIVPHFIGTSPGSTSLRQTLRRLGHTFATSLGIPPVLPDDLFQLIERVQALINEVAATRPVILLLDALNQFDSADSPHGMYWFPRELPPTMRVIFSTLAPGPGEAAAELRPEVQALRARGTQVREVALPPLDQTDARTIITDFLTRYGKRLSAEQETAFVGKAESGSPLYLRVALEELRTLGTYAEITNCLQALPGNVPALVRWIFTVRLATDPGFRDKLGQPIGDVLVSRVASLLGASRFGLSQVELVELVDPGDPLGNLAALQRLLQPYLMRRGELLDFYHAQFRQAVEVAYLAHNADRIATHRTLADFFHQHADPAGKETWTDGTPRAFRELPYHILKAEVYNRSFALACDEQFLTAQSQAFPSEPSLPLETIKQAIRSACALDDAGKVAKFSLRHAKRVVALSQETPLDALRAGNLRRAWELADLADINSPAPKINAARWLFLLAWVLTDTGRRAEASSTLARLYEKDFPPLTEEWLQRIAAEVLSEVAQFIGDTFYDLSIRLMTRWSLPILGQLLCRKGLSVMAVSWVSRIQDKDARVEALKAIAITQVQMGDFAQALQTIDNIEIPFEFDRVEALQSLSAAQIRAGEHMGAQRTHKVAQRLLTQAMTMEPRSQNDEDHDRRLACITDSQAWFGDFAAAHVTACQVVDRRWKAHAFLCLATAQARAGDVAGARETFAEVRATAKQIDRTHRRAEVLEQLATAQGRVGDFAEAHVTACQVEGSFKTRALLGLATAQARAGDTAGARETFAQVRAAAQQIENAGGRAEALNTLATAQAQAGDTAGARETFAQVRAAAQQIENAGGRAEALNTLATAQAQAGDTAGALETFAQVRAAAQQIENAGGRAEALNTLATAQAQAGDTAGARETFAQVRAAVKQIEYAEGRIKALQALAAAQVRTGDRAEAQEIFAQILKPLLSIEAEKRYAWALRALAIVQAQAGDLSQALATAQQVESSADRTVVLHAIARAQARRGDITQALSTAKEIEDAHWRGYTLQAISTAQAKAGDRAGAQQTFSKGQETIREAVPVILVNQEEPARLQLLAINQADAGNFTQGLSTAEEIKDAQWRGYTLNAIATAQAEAGDLAGAQQTFARATVAAQQIGYAREEAFVLERIATVQAQVGNRADAQRTFIQARNAVQRIEDAHERSGMARKLATIEARAGQGNDAVQTIDYFFGPESIDRIHIADALAESGDGGALKHILIPCANNIEATYQLCSALAIMYPAQALDIAKVIREETW